MVNLELVLHPVNVQHPEAIRAEYGMDGEVLRISARAAVAGYLLRSWSVDCSDNYDLRGPEFALWLRNRRVLHGMANLTLAPGYAKRSPP